MPSNRLTLNPALAARYTDLVRNPVLSTVLWQRDKGKPREQIGVPIAPQGRVDDTVLYEHATDAAKRYYVPRYEVVLDETGANTRFGVQLRQTEAGGELSVRLRKTVPPELAAAASTAQEIEHEMTVVLEYRLGVEGAGAVRKLAFQLYAEQAGIVTATLEVTPSEMNQLYPVLRNLEWGARLVIERTVNVAVPAPGESAQEAQASPLTRAAVANTVAARASANPVLFNAAQPAPAAATVRVRPSPATARVNPAVIARQPGVLVTPAPVQPQPRIPVTLPPIGRPPVTRPPVTRPPADDDNTGDFFIQVRRTVAYTPEPNPFAFDEQLHPYVYSNISGLSDQPLGLVRRQVEYKRAWHSYYQDEARPHVFLYLPDSFKIARREETPHYPLMAVAFASADGSVENMQVTMQYVAAPVLSAERLEDARVQLRVNLPPGNDTAIAFEPLLPESVALRLMLPGAAAALPRDDAIVDLRSGIHDQIVMPLTQFQAIFEALMGASAMVLRGEVTMELGTEAQPQREAIPLIARLDDLAGELLDVSVFTDAQADGYTITLRNGIESPCEINVLVPTLYRNAIAVTGQIDSLQRSGDDSPTALPLTLAADEEVRGLLVHRDELPGDGLPLVFLDGSEIDVQPNKEAVWDVIVDPSLPAEYTHEVQVFGLAEWFEPPQDPDQQILAIVIKFERGTTVQLRADTLEAVATVQRPIADLVIRSLDEATYRYRTTVIRRSGDRSRSDWLEDIDDMLFPVID